MKEEGIFNGVF